MINFNGHLVNDPNVISAENRGLNYGDALFETIKVSHGTLLFWEDHYFRLMASMRILRMEIPMNFTMEYLESQVKNCIEANSLLQSTARVKLLVYRQEGGFYLPNSNEVGYLITCKPLDGDFYLLNDQAYEVDLFKDYYIAPNLLSTLKTNNKVCHVVGSVFAKENDLNNCLLLNTDKHVIEALNANLFLVYGTQIKTPPILDGCLKGVMRKQVIDIIKAIPEYELEETSISPFELQKADELFLTNTISGIQPITKYRKKLYVNNVSNDILQKLNVSVRLVN